MRTRPPFTVSQAESAAATHWGLHGTASILPGDRDRNFRLDTATDTATETETHTARYVVKFLYAGDPPELWEVQRAALAAAAESVGSAVGSAPDESASNAINGSTEGSRRFISPEPVQTTAGGWVAHIEAADGTTYRVAMLRWVYGKPFVDVNPHDSKTLSQIGTALARLDRSLARVELTGDIPSTDWDLQHADRVVSQRLDYVEDPERRGMLERVLARFRGLALDKLPRQLVHNDVNDHNVLVRGDGTLGLIDFGDVAYSWRVADLAIAAAYACMDADDAVGALGALTSGFHRELPLTDPELNALPVLMATRLAASVATSAERRIKEPQDAYQTVSEAPAWRLLTVLDGIHPRFVTYRVRQACFLTPCPQGARLEEWLTQSSPAPVVPSPGQSPDVFDLSVGTTEFDGGLDPLDVPAWEEILSARVRSTGADVGLGRYLEPRICYQAEQFASAGYGPERQRTIHIGVDVFAPAGTPVCTAYDAVVHSVADLGMNLDYGPTVILRHEADGEPFWTLYGHLGRGVLGALSPGDTLTRGAAFAEMGDVSVNGGWPPHLHYQVVADLLDFGDDVPGVALASERGTWASLCPDPNLILRYDAPVRYEPPKSEGLRARRTSGFGTNLSLSYADPLHIVRGIGAHLFDPDGRAYLDCVNNVCHVGHAHPAVVQAAARQLSVLNTNTRYLHDNILEYGERLAATLPDGLDVCFFTNSGSEANDLALRLARAATGDTGIVAVETGYHGNLSSLVDASSYKFDGAGGSGRPDHVRLMRVPDTLRGGERGTNAGARFGEDARSASAELAGTTYGVSAFLHESILSCGGQIVPPGNWLKTAYEIVRQHDAVCIADEVQTGFGRVGSHFWSFELQGAVPDIVTMGKPIGNGFPLGAVVTTRAIAERFANGMEYFNTYGGNPVSCAVGLAVLDVIESEGLQARALDVGTYLMGGIAAISAPLIADVRGAGMFLGFELMLRGQPAAAEAAHLVNRMKEKGVLLSTDGPDHNVIKIKPPLAFSRADADEVVGKLSVVLAEDVFAL